MRSVRWRFLLSAACSVAILTLLGAGCAEARRNVFAEEDGNRAADGDGASGFVVGDAGGGKAAEIVVPDAWVCDCDGGGSVVVQRVVDGVMEEEEVLTGAHERPACIGGGPSVARTSCWWPYLAACLGDRVPPCLAIQHRNEFSSYVDVNGAVWAVRDASVVVGTATNDAGLTEGTFSAAATRDACRAGTCVVELRGTFRACGHFEQVPCGP